MTDRFYPVSAEVQRAADYLYEETTKLDAPISMTACLVLAKHIFAQCSPDIERAIFAAAREVDWAVEQTEDHVQWFPALAKLRKALRTTQPATPTGGDVLTVETMREAVQSAVDAVAFPISRRSADSEDARRYRRLRVLGVAPSYTKHLEKGEVMRFTNLDDFVDEDIAQQPRGEATTAAQPSADSEDAAEFDWSLSNRLRADFLHGEIAVWNTLVEAADEIDRLNDAAQAVPVADLLAVVEIADRNEYAPQISRVKAWLSSLHSPQPSCHGPEDAFCMVCNPPPPPERK